MTAEESRQMTGTASSAPAWRTWDGFRCRHCRRLLLKITPDALKPAAALEIKCACKVLNYQIGRDHSDQELIGLLRALDPVRRAYILEQAA